MPLVSRQTLSALQSANTDGMSMLTLTVDNPFGLGRIKRDANGNIEAIVEQKDASDAEQQITEINSGIYCVDNALLHKYLPKLSNDNAQNEYYLTDIVKMAVADGIAIAAIEPEHAFEIEGVNNRQQLASLERSWQNKLVHDLQVAGVQFADPTRVDIRGSLSAGQDVFVDVNVVFEGDCTLGDNVYIEAGNASSKTHKSVMLAISSQTASSIKQISVQAWMSVLSPTYVLTLYYPTTAKSVISLRLKSPSSAKAVRSII